MKILEKKSQGNYEYLVSRDSPNSFVTESLQKTIINLEYANIDGKYKIIQFTSSVQSEGKTTLISNLAYLLAQRGKKVLTVDLDLRRPKLNRVYGVINKDGLTDYLLGKIDKNSLINHSEDKVDFITTGEKTTSITNVLQSAKLLALFEELKKDYDYILLDTPPVIVVSDALFVNRIADGIIFVVAHAKAKKALVKEAISSLSKTTTPIIGFCMTQYKVSRGSKYGYTYKYYD
ncbi:capsular exopolysaccharide synthesis family protein [Acholeplasma morum]|uniref:CpsD/CapB family tyrosine-protein kinase n=1 Tax=Paracholeplasma morum TaxID=264637 RepID=UPI00195A5326|nr:CpsD/CapB family tyrosine-protein kinase [Paracholeplasma morum]MBM7452818.1 capsular exopolysaccharide synthesis family protein [Paracholeplasma morum]